MKAFFNIILFAIIVMATATFSFGSAGSIETRGSETGNVPAPAGAYPTSPASVTPAEMPPLPAPQIPDVTATQTQTAATEKSGASTATASATANGGNVTINNPAPQVVYRGSGKSWGSRTKDLFVYLLTPAPPVQQETITVNAPAQAPSAATPPQTQNAAPPQKEVKKMDLLTLFLVLGIFIVVCGVIGWITIGTQIQQTERLRLAAEAKAAAELKVKEKELDLKEKAIDVEKEIKLKELDLKKELKELDNKGATEVITALKRESGEEELGISANGVTAHVGPSAKGKTAVTAGTIAAPAASAIVTTTPPAATATPSATPAPPTVI